MYKILTYNTISPIGLARLPLNHYEVASEIQHPDAILLRSQELHGVPIPDSVKAVGRAGAGTNNIPVPEYSQRGIPVFNAPGANANAVKELVLAGLLLAARHIPAAWDFARHLEGDDVALQKQVEKGKKNFAGIELAGKTLGVLGLGAIGVKVANAADALGLKVIGFDPLLTVESAWQLSSTAVRARSVDELLANSDFISLHVPLNEHTKKLLDTARLAGVKPGAVLLNFSRGGVVEEEGVIKTLASGRLSAYVTDFPSRALLDQPQAIVLPHLGASTEEAEVNCAIMVADQVRDFLENGNIQNAVNFPDVILPCNKAPVRLSVANRNVPNMVGQISTTLAEARLNIVDLVNKSLGDYAYTLIDLDSEVPAVTFERIRAIEGVLSARLI
jgi:D-3-phosphoglycerate dehydrogenase